jgi:hypothetical protein
MRERSLGSFRTSCEAFCLSPPRLARGFENDWYKNSDIAILMNRRKEEESRRKAFLDVWRFRLNGRKVERTSRKEKDWHNLIKRPKSDI